MNEKTNIKVLLLALLFIGITKSNALESKAMALSDFLTEISEKHEVFFTYDPLLISGENLNPEEYNYNVLNKIINKLERKTRFDFEYLGNKYYVVYHKKEKKVNLKTVTNLQGGITPISTISELQNTVSGIVTDQNGEPLAGVNIVEKGTTNGTTTDFDGNYTIDVNEGGTLVYSYIGFDTVEELVQNRSTINITLSEGVQLDELVLVGSRNPNRTSVNTAVAVDVIDVAEMATKAPQTTVNEILNYVAPSFTSQTQTVSDGTDHIDPASLRGLGPDQVLVLINGKRRHTSALINVNGTVGAGSVGTDMNAIPTAAIKRIEVLRDGAAAQYGSDAIAGVINIVLKKDTKKLDLTVTTGANFSENSNHFEGGVDGEKFKIDANYGLPIGEDGGFINFTGTLSTRQPALRNKDYAGDIFRGFHGAERIFAAGGGNVADMTLFDYQNAAASLSYLDPATTAQIAGLDLNQQADIDSFRGLLNFDADEQELAARGLTREDFRFKVGTSKLREGKFFFNSSIPVSENAELYSFGGISYRSGLASGFYRRPAQGDGRANTPAFPNGFLPSIGSDIVDKSLSAGIKGIVNEYWNVDFSNTYGQNTFQYTVGNSSNGTLGTGTQRSFDAGTIEFTQNITNLDASRFYDDIFDGLNVAMGLEFKVENYSIAEGEETSYTSYDINGDIVTASTLDNLLVRNNFTGTPLGGGSQVFRGFDPNNATNKTRNSIASYIDLELDFSEAFYMSLAGRYENFSDFGGTFNTKIAARYKLSENLNLRSAFNTGFRAPSLHQQFFSRTSTVFENNVPKEQGTFTNDSRLATLLGIDKLKEETSASFSAGITGKIPDLNLTFTIDGYLINIDDRIVYSGSFGPGTNTDVQAIFNAAGANTARFFVNAIDTKTKGIDIVIGHKASFGEDVILKSDIAANFTETTIDALNIPSLVASAGQTGSFFDAQEEAFLTLAQPRTKFSLSNNLSFKSWNFLLRNTYFGEVQDPDDFAGTDRVSNHSVLPEAVYGGKLVTDLTVSYKCSDNLNISIGANNLFDVYPDENRPGGTSGDQFVFSRRTSQFGYTGRFAFAKLNFTLK